MTMRVASRPAQEFGPISRNVTRSLCKAGDLFVTSRYLARDGIRRARRTGKDAQQENWAVWAPRQIFRNRRPDAFRDLVHHYPRGRVIGADHQHHQLGIDPIHLAHLQPPEKVLHPVRGDPEIDRISRAIMFLPRLRLPAPFQKSVIESPSNTKSNCFPFGLLQHRLDPHHPLLARHGTWLGSRRWPCRSRPGSARRPLG